MDTYTVQHTVYVYLLVIQFTSLFIIYICTDNFLLNHSAKFPQISLASFENRHCLSAAFTLGH